MISSFLRISSSCAATPASAASPSAIRATFQPETPPLYFPQGRTARPCPHPRLLPSSCPAADYEQRISSTSSTMPEIIAITTGRGRFSSDPAGRSPAGLPYQETGPRRRLPHARLRCSAPPHPGNACGVSNQLYKIISGLRTLSSVLITIPP